MSFDPSEFPKVLTLYLAISQYPILAPRIRERMRQELFKRGVIRPEALEEEVVEKAVQSQHREGITDPINQEPLDTWQRRIAIIRDNLTDFYFAYNLPYEHFEQLLKDTLSSRLPHQDVFLTIHPELAPWDMLFAQGEAYEALSDDERTPVEHHLTEIKVVLIKSMLSDHLPYLGIAKDWFTIHDLKSILSHRIGRGKIGGKAAGLMLAENILRKSGRNVPLSNLRFPRSWFLGADVFYQFNQMNNLYVFANQKYKDEEQIRNEHPNIQRDFQKGQFPKDIVAELRDLLNDVGDSPLIVRSSSLLEDSFGTSFAGKYESYFCPNQGTPEENLKNLLIAIKCVYASVYNPDVLLYRRSVGLTDYDERMAVLIQEATGRRRGDTYFPDGAGVAFSRNQFRWNPRISRSAGFLRLVFGLGTRAVEQVGDDYPRLVALSHPDLRPESSPREIHRYSQSELDLIDLQGNVFTSMPIAAVLQRETPHLRWVAQLYEQDDLQDLVSIPVNWEPEKLVVTFDGLLRRTTFPDQMRRILDCLENAYKGPVDTEFVLMLDDNEGPVPQPVIYLVQCRPQSHLISESHTIPRDIHPEQRLFFSTRMVPDGSISDVRYAVYVSPEAFGQLGSHAKKVALARLIGRINLRLQNERFILIGPGRWGSYNPDIGIPVSYADIYRAKALIELAEGERAPEPSYGTHFFQDLVEAQIYPLAVSMHTHADEFNQDFFESAPNALHEVLPEDTEWEKVVRVIDVPASTEGSAIELVMDGNEGQALAYLKAPGA
jgi:hypothetical protein